LLLTIVWSIAAFAQDQPGSIPAPPPSEPAQRSAEDLEKLTESIALYPDPLIAVILPAAAYPVEIVQAARFVSNTNNLATLDTQPWDDNVKAVARFPAVIQKMSDELAWTVELGQAFVEQPLDLMDAIQSLRTRAQSVGTLQTTPQQVVTVTNAVVQRTYETQVVYVTNTIVQIMPANPQVVYVPVYTPAIVYAPPPAYVYSPAVPLITFGVGIAVGAIIANNHCNWYYGGVYYGRGGFIAWGGGRYPYYPPPPRYRPPPYRPPPGYRPPPPGYRPPYRPPENRPATLPTRWQPDQNRLRRSGSPGGAQAAVTTMEARGWGSGPARPATQPAPATRPSPSTPTTGAIGNRPSLGNNPAPPATGTVGNRPSTTPGTRPSSGAGANRPSPGTAPSVSQPTARPAPGNPGTGPGTTRPAPATRPTSPRQPSYGGALSDLNSGAAAQNFGNRGAVSRGNNRGTTGGRGSPRQ
jgi:hypothetical protein